MQGSARPAEPQLERLAWAKALAIGVVVYLLASVALAYVGVPNFGLLGYFVGGVVVGRIAGARTWRRWVAAFALLFVVVVVIAVAAIAVLQAIR